MEALLKVKFNKTDLIDKKAIKEEFGGSVLLYMIWLFDEENMGLFDSKVELIGIRETRKKKNP